MNFMDNMDGLAGGVATVAASLFLAGTLLAPQPQWFVAACLALLAGACLGFLCFNWPRKGGATIFMGDSGSLLLGFLLAFLTVRTTYVSPSLPFLPRLPLVRRPHSPHRRSPCRSTDFTSVTLILLEPGPLPLRRRSPAPLPPPRQPRPLQVCRRRAVICGFTAITGLVSHAISPPRALPRLQRRPRRRPRPHSMLFVLAIFS